MVVGQTRQRFQQAFAEVAEVPRLQTIEVSEVQQHLDHRVVAVDVAAPVGAELPDMHFERPS